VAHETGDGTTTSPEIYLKRVRARTMQGVVDACQPVVSRDLASTTRLAPSSRLDWSLGTGLRISRGPAEELGSKKVELPARLQSGGSKHRALWSSELQPTTGVSRQ